MTKIAMSFLVLFLYQVDTMLEFFCLSELTCIRTEIIAGGHYSRTETVFTSKYCLGGITVGWFLIASIY